MPVPIMQKIISSRTIPRAAQPSLFALPQIPTECSQIGATPLFVLFWLLEPQDVHHPKTTYTTTISTITTMLNHQRKDIAEIESRLDPMRSRQLPPTELEEVKQKIETLRTSSETAKELFRQLSVDADAQARQVAFVQSRF